MEAFSLLKYWRGGGVGASPALSSVVSAADKSVSVPTTRATTIVAAAVPHNNTPETDDDEDDAGDDGPFFDLEFAIPDDEEEEEEDSEDNKNKNNNNRNRNNKKKTKKEERKNVRPEECDPVNDVAGSSDSDSDEGEPEFNFTLSSGSGSGSSSNNDRTDPNLSLSPSDDLFFKGRLVPVETSSSSPLDSTKNQFPVASLLKSANKFRVFTLGFKKSKMQSNEKVETTPSRDTNSLQNQLEESLEGKEESDAVNKQSTNNSKLFTVKFNVEEVPVVSLFTRENSKSVKTTSSPAQKRSSNQSSEQHSPSAAIAGDDKQRFSKDVMQKYLKKVKPLYIRVSKRYGDKLKFSGQLRFKTAAVTEQKSVSPTAAEAVGEEAVPVLAVGNNAAKCLKQGGNMPAGLRVVCKHLGKSRSASSAAVAAVAAAPAAGGPVGSRRRDDSLLQQQDGIQSAILHCKRSFNASRDSESSLLSRSVSDPSSHEK